MTERRDSGILLPLFSLPGPYGIGTLGSEARLFVDFLARAGQRYWQLLPLVPPGEGNSPYMSHSSFAGSPFFIDLEALHEEGLLTPVELESAMVDAPDRVDYDFLRRTRLALLRRAHRRVLTLSFPGGQPDWLMPYAHFMALREVHGPLHSWAEQPGAPDPERLSFHLFLQRVFYRQWFALKDYANARGVALIGDLPIYVSADSADLWQTPSLFRLDGAGRPDRVAGVPPDAFSATGQLWGNPLYDWAGRRDAVFSWWSQRVKWAARLYDAARIDHFRGFHTYWSVPAGAKSAAEGRWECGPGLALVDQLRTAAPGLPLIAEDLGELSAEARAFTTESGLPGMKVLLYAFDPARESTYLPHNAPPHAVMYTGTHDTPTFVEWLFDEADERSRAFATDYLCLRADEGYGWGAVRGAWASPCALAVAPLADVLGLGRDARVNRPGTVGPHNWSWRVRREALNPAVADRLLHLTRTYGRCP